MTEHTRVVGKIIKVSKDGWGFISSRQIEFTRIFFHWTALKQDTLSFLDVRKGMLVEFTPVQIPDKGWRALHVRVIEQERKEPENVPTDVSTLPESGPEDDREDNPTVPTD